MHSACMHEHALLEFNNIRTPTGTASGIPLHVELITLYGYLIATANTRGCSLAQINKLYLRR